MEGKKQEAAAAAAGMSLRTARKWQTGPLPSERRKARTWRTRLDPFEAHWQSDIVPLLEADPDRSLQATTVLDVLIEKHPEIYSDKHLRTLQRRMRDWRALHGPEREVFFPQEHVPGRECQLDFTSGNELGITINGIAFVHLLFELVLSFSGWRWVCLAFSETFEALSAGLQGALWELGGATELARHDNLSAATHELKGSKGRALTERWKAVLDHYGMGSTRIFPGRPNENGVAEQSHYRLKTAIDQALIIRGTRDFESRATYEEFIAGVVAKLNRRVADKLAVERQHLRPLPKTPVPAYTTYQPRVRKWSTIRVRNRTYSVPSRLIGHQVEARLHPEIVEIYYNGELVETMERLRGEGAHRIDYRHVIWSLVRKPGAFARYKYREELFPSLVFRRAYDSLRDRRGERADVEYVRILHLAASTTESEVERALAELLDRSEPFDYAAVKALAAPEPSSVPVLSVPATPDLAVYDQLLAGGAR